MGDSTRSDDPPATSALELTTGRPPLSLRNRRSALLGAATTAVLLGASALLPLSASAAPLAGSARTTSTQATAPA